MNLYIMTRGRVGNQVTLQSIPRSWRSSTWLVCPTEEYGKHEHQTITVPDWVDSYSKKMKWIIEDGMGDRQNKCVILDDDLVFSRRVVRSEKPALQTVVGAEIDSLMPTLFAYIEMLLEDTALVGVHPRQMGHVTKLPFEENGKVICVQGINRELVGKIPDLDRFPILSDVVLNATLLSRGQGNKIITSFCQNWGPSQAPGGCALYRTPEMQAEACYWLEARFGPYIKAVEKESQNGWLGGKRVDFRGQWKALYNAGVTGVLDDRAGTDTAKEGSGGTEAVE